MKKLCIHGKIYEIFFINSFLRLDGELTRRNNNLGRMKMKRLWEVLKIGLVGLLATLTGFTLCCLGGIFAISIVNIFTYSITAIVIASIVGYFTTIVLILIVILKWINKQKNSQNDTRK